MEEDKTFDIEDYGKYFVQSEEDKDTSSTDNTSLADAVQEDAIIKSGVTDSDTSYQTIESTVQDINAHVANIEVLSIASLVALGLIVGIALSKIFLDKLWR